VSLEFSPSSAVPGEKAKMQLSAQPDSLCGVSAVDQSVLILEPGKTLDAEKVPAVSSGRIDFPSVFRGLCPAVFALNALFAFQIFDLLPVRAVSNTPYQVEDPAECLRVRQKRYVLPYPGEETNDAHKTFSVRV